MARFGLDYAGPCLSASKVKSAGCDFIIRYLSGWNWPKNLTLNEVKDMSANGVDICTVFETSADFVLRGAAGGAADGQLAGAQARMLGQPKGRPIYIGVDFDATLGGFAQSATAIGNMQTIHAYRKAFEANTGGYPAGIYGSRFVLDWLYTNTDLFWGWQCIGWSYLNRQLVWHPRVQLRQDVYNFWVGGVNTDRNTAMANDFGQWRLGVAAPAPADDLMRLTQPYQHNDGIKFMQTIAVLKGLAPAGFAIDGVFGPATEALVKSIQQKAGLLVDGICGPKTLDWMSKYTVPAQLVPDKPKPPVAPKPPVPPEPVPEPFKGVFAKPGDTGPLVGVIQNSLNVISKCGLKVNGSYDAPTTQAVKNFQNFVKFPVTGTVDSKTMATLQYFLSLKG